MEEEKGDVASARTSQLVANMSLTLQTECLETLDGGTFGDSQFASRSMSTRLSLCKFQIVHPFMLSYVSHTSSGGNFSASRPYPLKWQSLSRGGTETISVETMRLRVLFYGIIVDGRQVSYTAWVGINVQI